MFEVRILDDYVGSIVHIAVGNVVYHVDITGDQCNATCIETDDSSQGNSRQEVLERMGIALLARHTGVRGVTA